MIPVSLLGVASDLPDRIVENDFFAAGAAERRGMFTAPTTRRHVGAGERASASIARAARRLIEQRRLDPREDIDILLTNVALPDEAFTGAGAEVAHLIGARPRLVLDLHNSGCVSALYMTQLARALMAAGEGRSALVCNVQNAAGRVFAQPLVRTSTPAPVPGDGTGVSYLRTGDFSPVLSVIVECHGEFASDMTATAADGRHYWEPGTSPITLGFTERRVATIIERGNRVVPEMVERACGEAGVRPRDLNLLITNQPNPIFLRNWREALEIEPERHHDTFDQLGNLFGAAIPINLESALAQGKLAPGDLIGFGGFSHAGDYAAAAVVRWGGNNWQKGNP
jgi:3-oxoacyl-[acyl-carrier-protein] synthase III